MPTLIPLRQKYFLADSVLLLLVVLIPVVLPAQTVNAAEPAACQKTVVLMGYWPPTNEMLRPWSPDPGLRAASTGTDAPWQGENWQQRGVNVYAFFPEFPPDGDPGNDPIGSAGSVGSTQSDLQVDFQDTSADFWRIVDHYQPQILITTSRGGSIGWEIEALEGGHGSTAAGDPALDWLSDRYGTTTHPEQDSVDRRSWQAISTYRNGHYLPSSLPIEAILAATSALELTDVAIDEHGTSGNYLSGFLGLHGIYYERANAHAVAAGHIHVGRHVNSDTAHELMVTTLATVLNAHPAATLPCPK
jgi:hypothetical protein